MRPSAVQEARIALALRLREIRVSANLTATSLARRSGWQHSKVSKIEHARQAPTADDISTWCTQCGATDQITDLVASLRAVEGMWIEWRRLTQGGLRHLQENPVSLYENTRQFRIYEADIVPGLFQTLDYAAATMRSFVYSHGFSDDSEQAAEARIDRQRVLETGGPTFSVVLEEQALSSRVCDTDVMAGQLGQLITVAAMPRVQLGIIPRNITRSMVAWHGFWLFDDERVTVETMTARLTITQPRELAVYARAFDILCSMAVYGSAARRLIAEAITALG